MLEYRDVSYPIALVNNESVSEKEQMEIRQSIISANPNWEVIDKYYENSSHSVPFFDYIYNHGSVFYLLEYTSNVFRFSWDFCAIDCELGAVVKMQRALEITWQNDDDGFYESISEFLILIIVNQLKIVVECNSEGALRFYHLLAELAGPGLEWKGTGKPVRIKLNKELAKHLEKIRGEAFEVGIEISKKNAALNKLNEFLEWIDTSGVQEMLEDKAQCHIIQKDRAVCETLSQKLGKAAIKKLSKKVTAGVVDEGHEIIVNHLAKLS